MKTPLLSNGLWILVVIGLLLMIGLFVVEGCGSDPDVDRQLKENQEQIERLETQKDSIEALRGQLADTLAILALRIEDADADREAATRQTRFVLELINSMSSYENLTHDALAEHADSLYLARADDER